MPAIVRILIIVTALPVLLLPVLLSKAPAEGPAKTFICIYPAYVLLSAVCEWLCWSRRPELTWILIVMMLLTHASIWALVLL